MYSQRKYFTYHPQGWHVLIRGRRMLAATFAEESVCFWGAGRMRRAIVLIGVANPGNPYAELKAAYSGLDSMRRWANPPVSLMVTLLPPFTTATHQLNP